MERSAEIRVGAKRPTVGKVVILAAAEKVAAGLGKGADAVVDLIVKEAGK